MSNNDFLDTSIQHVNAVIRQIMQNRERYVQAWVAETGIDPSDAVLIQQNVGSEIKIWVRPKTESELEIDRLKADGRKRIAFTRDEFEELAQYFFEFGTNGHIRQHKDPETNEYFDEDLRETLLNEIFGVVSDEATGKA